MTGVHGVTEMAVMEGIDGETDVVVSGSDRAEARSANVTLNGGCNDVSTTWNNDVGACSRGVTLNIRLGIVMTFVNLVELGTQCTYLWSCLS